MKVSITIENGSPIFSTQLISDSLTPNDVLDLFEQAIDTIIEPMEDQEPEEEESE